MNDAEFRKMYEASFVDDLTEMVLYEKCRVAELELENQALRENQIKGHCKDCEYSTNSRATSCCFWGDGVGYCENETEPLGYCHEWEKKK